MRSTNPVLRSDPFSSATAASGGEAMTVDGAIHKSGFLIVLVVAAALFSWHQMTSAIDEGVAPSMAWVWGGALVGFGLALITVFVKTAAPFTSPLYALAEGLFLGGISALMEMRYPGIVVQAVFATTGVFVAMLVLYRARIIEVNRRFRTILFAATGGIMVVYLLSFVLGFFGMSIPLIHSSGPFGILFSLVVVGVAAFNLMLDFDLIERGARSGAPKWMEWFAAFALLVTLVWLYLEILRLLSKIRSR